jgi:translation initiation factor IF-2
MSEFRVDFAGAVAQYQAAYAALKAVPLGQPQPSVQRHAEVGARPRWCAGNSGRRWAHSGAPSTCAPRAPSRPFLLPPASSSHVSPPPPPPAPGDALRRVGALQGDDAAAAPGPRRRGAGAVQGPRRCLWAAAGCVGGEGWRGKPHLELGINGAAGAASHRSSVQRTRRGPPTSLPTSLPAPAPGPLSPSRLPARGGGQPLRLARTAVPDSGGDDRRPRRRRHAVGAAGLRAARAAVRRGAACGAAQGRGRGRGGGARGARGAGARRGARAQGAVPRPCRALQRQRRHAVRGEACEFGRGRVALLKSAAASVATPASFAPHGRPATPPLNRPPTLPRRPPQGPQRRGVL